MSCQYLSGHKAGEPDGDGGASTWTEYDCSKDQDTCPYLDDHDVECPIKETVIGHVEDFAIRQVAGDRKDKYTAAHERMLEAEP